MVFDRLDRVVNLVDDGERLTSLPTVRESLLYKEVGDGGVRCLLCERRCLITKGGKGFCGTRMNISGRLYTLIYGDLSSTSMNPIEKKPFFHFYPGSYAITVGSWSCNFTCPWCQNWEISKRHPNPFEASYTPAEKLVREASKMGCDGTSISFNEPALLHEYSIDIFKEARRLGLYNTYVSNGYMSLEALRMLAEAGLDAINIDVKGNHEVVSRYCGVDVEKVWRNVEAARGLGLHVEVVFLIILGVNDSPEVVRWVAEKHIAHAGEDVPLHLTRFYPAYQMVDKPATPVRTLEDAYRICRGMGIEYVYLGNVPGHRYENTYCPECGELLVARYGFEVLKCRLTSSSRCPRCGVYIPILGSVKASPNRHVMIYEYSPFWWGVVC